MSFSSSLTTANIKKGGLKVFISDIRNCGNKEEEKQRVQKELANIRAKFTSAGKKGLKSYDKKKYVWKLVYIYMLGYEVDIGHMEVINLVSSSTYSEKHVGYLAAGVLLRNTDELMTLVVNSIRNDLKSKNDFFQGLALCAIANLGGKEITEGLAEDVMSILTASYTVPTVRKKAALCMLSLFRNNPEVICHEEFSKEVVKLLQLTETKRHMGILLSLLGLLLTVIPKAESNVYDCIFSQVVGLLESVAIKKTVERGYIYHEIPAPWIQIKLLKLLQQFDMPENEDDQQSLYKVMKKIVKTKPSKKKGNKRNAEYSVLIETINLIVHYGSSVEVSLQEEAITQLGQFITAEESNMRYLGLSGLIKLALMAQKENRKHIGDLICTHQDTILNLLKDEDISLKKRALDLLFSMCNQEHSEKIVKELVDYLPEVSYTMKEEMVLKIAILAERFTKDSCWYIDTVLKLINEAGDFVSESILHRVIQVVTNNEESQLHASQVFYQALQDPRPHKAVVRVGAYILGEFGYLLAEGPEEDDTELRDTSSASSDVEVLAAMDIFEVLSNHFENSDNSTRCILLHAYCKLANLFEEELSEFIGEIMDAYRDSTDIELQQRACEYYALLQTPKDKVEYVLESMPRFPEDRASAVVRKLQKKESGEVPEPIKLVAKNTNEAKDSESVIGIDSNLIPKMKKWFVTSLTHAPKSLLFEDNIIQIGMQKKFVHFEGKILLFYGNKVSNASLNNFKVTLSEVAGLRINQMQDVNEKEIGSKTQLKQAIALTCNAPFTQPPLLTVSFSCKGQKYSYELRLPVVAATFAEPFEMKMTDYSSKWDKMIDREEQAEFEISSGEELKNAMGKLTASLKFAMIEDENSENSDSNIPPESINKLHAAGVIRTGADPESEQPEAAIGCLVQVEIDEKESKCKLSVRGMHPVATSSVKTVFQQHMATTA